MPLPTNEIREAPSDAGDDGDADSDICNAAADDTPCGEDDECTIGLRRDGLSAHQSRS